MSILELEGHQIDQVVHDELLTFKQFLERDYKDPDARVRYEDKKMDRVYVSDCIDAISIILEWYEFPKENNERRSKYTKS